MSGVVIIFLIELIVAHSFTPRSAYAATSGTWVNTKTGGVWSNPSNWAGGAIADGTDAIADFSTLNITANNTVTLDSPRTVGGLIFGDSTPSNNWTVSGSSLTLATSSGTPTIQVNNQTATIIGFVDTTQDLIKSGSGTLVISSSYGVFSARAPVIQINGGVLAIGSIIGAISVNVDGGFAPYNARYSDNSSIGGLLGSGNFSLPSYVNLHVAASKSGNAGVYSGVISGTGTLTVDGGSATSPALTLTGANTFSGTTNARGYLLVSNANALQNSFVTSGGIAFSSGIGTFTVGSSAGLVLNDVNGAPIKLRVGANNSDFSTGIFTGSGSLEKVGTGTMVFEGYTPQPFTGDLVVSAGSVGISFNDVKNNTVVVNADGGIKFVLGNIFHEFNIGGLSGAANLSLTESNGGGPMTLVVGFNNADTTYSGVMSGRLYLGSRSTLEKVGTGALTLTAANTFPGTYVAAGTLKVTGSLAQNGSANVLVAAGRDFGTASLLRRVQSRESYSGFGSATDDFALRMKFPTIRCTADIRVGKNNAGSANDLAMQWRIPNSNDVPRLVSDVLNLTGMSAVSGEHARTDPYALQMTYIPSFLGGPEGVLAANGLIDLAWLDTNQHQPNGLWVNATLGNFGTGLPGHVFQNVQSSWDAFAVANSINDSNVGDFLGSYGVDIAQHTAWAIINHNSQFSVVPEPASWLLLAIGTAIICAMRIRWQRNSWA